MMQVYLSIFQIRHCDDKNTTIVDDDAGVIMKATSAEIENKAVVTIVVVT